MRTHWNYGAYAAPECWKRWSTDCAEGFPCPKDSMAQDSRQRRTGARTAVAVVLAIELEACGIDVCPKNCAPSLVIRGHLQRWLALVCKPDRN